jgi:two-component system, NtrC family, nitrogen regulation response regulator NtrX
MAERILIVDDEAGIRSTLADILADERYETATAETAGEGAARLGRERFDLVLLDVWLPDRDGLELLKELKERDPELPVIVISGHGNVDSAVKAIRLGAYDFLEKPLSLSRVLLTVANALERSRLSREVRALADRFEKDDPLIGGSPRMLRLKTDLRVAAAAESRILITGENGTGKELVARQVHRFSPRARGPFVDVNCAAIPEELIESELFGHVKGAFTGAVADRAGRFEQADRGTLFLDEIADMSLKTQAKVLRVLQEQRFERVGGAATVRVDVRVLAATNKDLATEIKEGRFREDLYFRLAVIPLVLPPLRERREDLPALVEHFVREFAREIGRRPKAVAPAAMARLAAYAWPGNVRELRNVVERMMIMVPDETIEPADLPPGLRMDSAEVGPQLWEQDFTSLREARAAFEKHYIERKLAELGGNMSRTAQALGLERSHLYRKLRALDIETAGGD